MFVELSKRLRDIDDSFSLKLSISKEGIFNLEVEDNNGNYYSYGSSDIIECYNKINDFIEAMKDPDKFCKLLNSIMKEPMGV